MQQQRVLVFGAVLAALGLLFSGAPRAARAAGLTPTIESLTPDRGSILGGTTVTLTGTNFTAPMRVLFGELEGGDVQVINPTSLTVVVPANAVGAVDVIVEQTDEPVSRSLPLDDGYTYLEEGCPVWVPRAAGSATNGNPGGFDLALVETGNGGAELATLDLNAADVDLPTDTDWRPTQVIFNRDGSRAFVASVGTPFAFDSRKVWILSTARASGAETGNPVLGVIDTGGNPYQLALSVDESRLYVMDAGAWSAAPPPLPPNGQLRVYDVSSATAPVEVTGSPVATGRLPVLAYAGTSLGRWGSNSAFIPTVQSRGDRLVIANGASATLTVVNTGTLAVEETVSVAVPGGGPVQFSTATVSPWNDDLVYVMTTDSATGASRYFIFRVSQRALLDRGAVTDPVAFIPVLPVPRPAARLAWPHPDGQSLIVPTTDEAALAAWNAGTGSAENRTVVAGADALTDVAFDDTTGLYYARRDSGGWTVFEAFGSGSAAPRVVGSAADATGVDSLRVIRGGGQLAGTATSSLVLIDGRVGSDTAFQVVATIALSLDPAGGPLFPQPVEPGCGGPRTFVDTSGSGAGFPGPSIVFPFAGEEFCTTDDPPSFEYDETGTDGARRVELEVGNQPDFLVGPGSRTVRQRRAFDADEDAIGVNRRRWRRVLRRAADRVTHPIYARVNTIFPDGTRAYGDTATYFVCDPDPCDVLAPADAGGQGPFIPPIVVFESAGFRRIVVEFGTAEGFDGDAGVTARRSVPRRRIEPEFSSFPVPVGTWRRAVRRAGGPGATVTWRLACRDAFGRWVRTPSRTLIVDE